MNDEQLIHEAGKDEGGRRLLVARGDSRLDEGQEASLPSVLRAVSAEEWTQFVRGMIVAAVSAVSNSNALGMFEIMPRRLADLGLVERLTPGKRGKRTVWLAVFVPPMTCEYFLRSPQVQYSAFARSMRAYDAGLSSGEIKQVPDMSRSGALAILHRAGPKGLETWTSRERFPATQQLYDKVAGIF